MPRRAVASATPNRASSNVSFRDASVLPIPDASYLENISQLRRQWKWAAFSQFFYTFAQLLSMPDVNLSDIEDDLARGTAVYIPRVMQRLLYTLTQDRKISVENWQSQLRKQYLKRDPDANPLGVEPPAPSRKPSREPTVLSEAAVETGDDAKDGESLPHTPQANAVENEASTAEPSSPAAPENAAHEETEVQEEKEKLREPSHADTAKTEGDVIEATTPQDETKNWLDLPLLTRLDTLHLLTEWQFQTPHRLRTFMRDDGDAGHWRIEPIGYDAKTNAYWLIGPDRLWIQRVPPKPPRNRKRKAPAKKSAAKASTSKATAKLEPESEPEDEPSPAKRRRTTARTSSSRTSRSQAKEAAATSSGRGTRAAKLQANKKLDAQAKELAEFQRQAALLTSPQRTTSGRTTRQTRNSATNLPTPSRRPPPVGTRVSTRLRGSVVEDDDEWQQIPEEWLRENTEVDSEAEGSRRGKGKARATKPKMKGKTRVKLPVDDDDEDNGGGDEDEELKHLAEQAGLESDGESSVLTELSDEQRVEADEKEHVTDTPAPLADASPSKKEDVPVKSEEHPPQALDQKLSEDQKSQFPPGFIEWEAICVTLEEWEHVAEPFERATHYLEKALYKVLSQNIVPIVTAELREAERKRKLEEAIVRRKRSSRIAMKETEREEAKAAAKRKAEEEEKMGRIRRAEARAKKEEAEREKREKAREQRRLEREERERLKQEQQERESAEVEVVKPLPLHAPPVNGAATSHHASRVVTPSGSRSPDWILDCEICRRSGVNLDEGQAMVCCNACSRWQHIACHDVADRSAGRPPRDWIRQQFYCQRCRPTHTRVANGSTHGQPRPVEQYSWAPSHSQKAIPPLSQHVAHHQPTPDMRYSQAPNYDNATPYQQQYAHNAVPSQNQYPRMQRPQGGLTFSHYQPEQGGFSRTAQQPLLVPSPTWSNGYPPGNGMSPRPQQPMQYPPQYDQNSAYNGGRTLTSHQYHGNPQQPYSNGIQAPSTPINNGNWTSVPDNYFPPSSSTGPVNASQLTAAESLAFMQRGGRQSWPNGSVPPQQSNGYPPSVHLPTMAPHHFPPP